MLNGKKFYTIILISILFRTLTVRWIGATLASSVILMVLFYSLSFKTFSLKTNTSFVCLTSICVIITILSHGIIETKNVIAFFLMILVGPAIVKKYEFNPQWVYKYLCYGVIPLSFIYVLFYNGAINYLPFGDRLIICGYGTKHTNANVGFLLTLSSLFLYEFKKQKKGKII